MVKSHVFLLLFVVLASLACVSLSAHSAHAENTLSQEQVTALVTAKIQGLEDFSSARPEKVLRDEIQGKLERVYVTSDLSILLKRAIGSGPNLHWNWASFDIVHVDGTYTTFACRLGFPGSKGIPIQACNYVTYKSSGKTLSDNIEIDNFDQFSNPCKAGFELEGDSCVAN